MTTDNLEESTTNAGAGLTKWWWCLALSGLPLAVLLPVVGHGLRNDGAAKCAFDGQSIEPTYRVLVRQRNGKTLNFCCLHCAESWLAQSGERPLEIQVTEEVDGQLMDAAEAYFVSSSVLSNAPTGERRHVFRSLEQAQLHADGFHGRILDEEDRPFSALTALPTPDAPISQRAKSTTSQPQPHVQ